MPEPTQNDEQFLKLLRENDTKAFALLYHFHFKAVYENVRRFLKDREMAKDIVQELFMVIWEKRATLNISIPIRRYLLSAARNRAINYIRSDERYRQLIAEASAHYEPQRMQAADTAIEAKELNVIISQAISLLPDRIRIAFSLSRRIGLTYKEISVFTHVSEKMVEKNMSMGLKLMRIFLRAYL